MPDRVPRGTIRHEDYLDAAEALEWSSLHAEAARLDQARQAITARLNVIRSRASHRALAARRKEGRDG